jgi:hypothetical protein
MTVTRSLRYSLRARGILHSLHMGGVAAARGYVYVVVCFFGGVVVIIYHHLCLLSSQKERREIVEFALSKEMLVGIKRARHGCGGRAARRGGEGGEGERHVRDVYL